MRLIPTIGLEIHAEISTRTKMFCTSKNDPDEARPNVNVCPICLAHPGTLPVINRAAVRLVLRVGAAVGGELADYSEFDRKSYFYPDIPKGFQISQYAYPLVRGGSLVLSTSSGQASVALTRVHLEEDTARSSHARGKSLVDFNRAGVPLMELVTEPVIADAAVAGAFARELQLLLRTLGASGANLEKGEMRVEANVSVRDEEQISRGEFGTKVEVKNLNSFRSVERAIAYEIERQTGVLASGGKVVQETRGWDESRQATFSQRLKEGSADYRYFPEPDLPKLSLAEIPEFAPAAIRASLPELPWDRRARYAQSFGLKASDAAFLTMSPARADFFDAVARALVEPAPVRLAANYIVSDLTGIYGARGEESFDRLRPDAFAKLIRLAAAGTLSSRATKEILARLAIEGGDPEEIARKNGLLQVSDSEALRNAVVAVLTKEEKAVAEYRAGKGSVLQYLVGKAMQATRGAGNPVELRSLLEGELNK